MYRALSAAVMLALCPTCLPAQEIAFTWDDLPVHSKLPPGETRVSIASRIISAMKVAGLPPVYGFVNGIGIEHEPASAPVLDEWRAAGFLLGNHTWSHMNLNTSSFADWEADVLKNEPLLASHMAKQDWHWLRFPFLAEGETPQKREAARRFLADHQYKIAAVSMSFADYLYNDPYARCVSKHDDAAIAELEANYLAAAKAAIGSSRAMSRTLYGRDIPYVLLMHIGAMDARMLPRLLQLYRNSGFHFVRLETAEKDPFYRTDLDPSLPAAPDSLEQAMAQRKLPLPARFQPDVDLEKVCR